MIQARERLYNKEQTAKMMHGLVNKFCRDLSKFKIKTKTGFKTLNNLEMKEFFDFVRNIPYRMDNSPIEVISRPSHIIKLKGEGMDCKKKSILIGCYLKCNNIPYRFIASSNKPNKKIHHIFPQVLLGGEWKNLDATYEHYLMFEPKRVTKTEVV